MAVKHNEVMDLLYSTFNRDLYTIKVKEHEDGRTMYSVAARSRAGASMAFRIRADRVCSTLLSVDPEVTLWPRANGADFILSVQGSVQPENEGPKTAAECYAQAVTVARGFNFQKSSLHRHTEDGPDMTFSFEQVEAAQSAAKALQDEFERTSVPGNVVTKIAKRRLPYLRHSMNEVHIKLDLDPHGNINRIQ